MVVAAAPTILVDAGIAAGAVTAVLTCGGLIGRSRPGRWLWRQIVGAPVSDWLARTVDARVAPVRDQLDALSERTDQTLTRVEDHMHREEADRAEIIARLDGLAQRFDSHLPEAAARDARIDAHDQALGIDTRGDR